MAQVQWGLGWAFPSCALLCPVTSCFSSSHSLQRKRKEGKVKRRRKRGGDTCSHLSSSTSQLIRQVKKTMVSSPANHSQLPTSHISKWPLLLAQKLASHFNWRDAEPHTFGEKNIKDPTEQEWFIFLFPKFEQRCHVNTCFPWPFPKFCRG